MIRSATQVTAEVLEAGDELRRRRAGRHRPRQRRRRGGDPPRRHGRQRAAVERAVGGRAHDRAAARPGPQHPAGRPRPPERRSGTARRWEGVELHDKTLGIVGLGRVGVLVAQRANAFGMQLVAFDPYVSADRARQLGVDLVPTIEELVRRADFLTIHLPKTPDTVGLDLGRAAHPRQADAADRQHRPRRHRRRGRPGRRRARRSDRGRRARRVRARAHHRVAAVRARPRSWSRRTSARPRSRRRTRRARPSPSRSCSRSRGEFVPFAVNLAATEANATVQPFMPLAERLGRLFTALAGGTVDTLEITYEGQIADYDCRVLTLSVLKGVLGPVVDEPVSFVNAPQLAEERGLVVRETTSSSARDYVNLIELRGHTAGAQHPRRGHAVRQAGRAPHRRHRRLHRRPAAVEPHARRAQRGHAGHDRPGRRRSSAIDDGINIDELDLGRGPTGDVVADGAVDVHAGAGGGRRPSSGPSTASSTPAPSSSTDFSPSLASALARSWPGLRGVPLAPARGRDERGATACWRGGRRPRPRRPTGSSGRRGCGRSWRRRAGGRSRCSASPSPGGGRGTPPVVGGVDPRLDVGGDRRAAAATGTVAASAASGGRRVASRVPGRARSPHRPGSPSREELSHDRPHGAILARCPSREPGQSG